MEALSASQIISVWEQGVGEHHVDRALTLLAVACPGRHADQLAALDVATRDALLLRMRETMFGTTVNASAKCPRCAQSLEFTLLTTELSGGIANDLEPPDAISDQELAAHIRMPNSLDLRAAACCADVAEARALLLKRCLLGPNVEALTDQAIATLADRLCERDPFADVTLALQCVECGHAWQLIFDIATFLWNEIDALARRLMLQVAALARGYGWSEGDILSMGAARRQFYLEMAG